MQAIRFDTGTVTKVDRSKEGFLIARGVATRTGVFPYRNPDGSIRRELRHPDDVLAAESLQTLAGKPLTLEHPPGLVTPANFEQYSVGSVNNRVHVVGDGLVEVVFNVHRKDAIEDVESGAKRQLSCGYRCDVIEEKGVYNGEPYDYRQVGHQYNHLAIVERARAGEIASIHYDSEEGVEISVQDCECKWDEPIVHSKAKSSDSPQPRQRMATITIDSVTYDVPEAVAPVIGAKLSRLDNLEKESTQTQKLHKDAADRLDELEGQIKTLTAERDRAEGRADGLNDELIETLAELETLKTDSEGDATDKETETEAPAIDEAAIEARVQAEVEKRVDAMDSARNLLRELEGQGVNVPEIKLDAAMDSLAVQKAVVIGLNPGTEIADDEVKGYYKALSSGKAARNDSLSTFHADSLQAAIGAARGNDKKADDKDCANKKRMKNADAPLTMSKRSKA